MPRFRLEVTIKTVSNGIKVASVQSFEADMIEDAETIADAWAQRKNLSEKSTGIRIVRAEMILASRMINTTTWTRWDTAGVKEAPKKQPLSRRPALLKSAARALIS